MPRKKKEEEIEETQGEAVEEGAATEELNASAADTDSQEAAAADETREEDASLIESITETIASAVETVTDTASSVVETVSEAVGIGGESGKTGRGNRQEKIGVVSSDKMQKTVVVRVDRLVKHPMYRKYVKKRKKFMAHDELGAGIGDKVRIIETRPLSAHKRWRVVEIIQKAEK